MKVTQKQIDKLWLECLNNNGNDPDDMNCFDDSFIEFQEKLLKLKLRLYSSYDCDTDTEEIINMLAKQLKKYVKDPSLIHPVTNKLYNEYWIGIIVPSNWK